MYVLDCLKPLRALVIMVTRGVDFEVKKLAFAFGVLWKFRTGAADLRNDFEAAPRVAVSRNGCRIVKAMLMMVMFV